MMMLAIAYIIHLADVFLVGSIYGILAKRNWDNKRFK